MITIRFFCALVVLLTAAPSCKTSEQGAAVKDFDTGADPTLNINFDDAQTFCPDAERFNVANAYWLTLASAYSYASKDRLTEVADALRQEWKAINIDFFASPDSVNPLDPSSQALWIEGETTAVLAFRGTPLDRIDAQDVVSDVKALLVPFDGAVFGKVHKGFQLALSSLWPQLEGKLRALAQTNKKLFITGHSLGGALATLTAAHILATPELNSTVRKNLRGLYTIGSPRVGNAEFVSKFEASRQQGFKFPVVRMRNGQDIVTRIPSLGYKHVGGVFFMTEGGGLFSDDAGINAPRYKMTPGVAAQVKEGFLVTQLGELKEHLPVSYFEKIAAEYRAHKTWVKANNTNACNDAPFYALQQTPSSDAQGITKLADLEKLSDAQLRKVFGKGVDDIVPSTDNEAKTADGDGLPIIFPGAILVNNLAYNVWEGKRFSTDDSGNTTLVNKLAGNLVEDITAKVVKIQESLSFGDGRGAILLDYSGSNRSSARAIRDEIRRVGPGIYLGRAHLENHPFAWPILGRYKFVIWFALGFKDSGMNGATL